MLQPGGAIILCEPLKEDRPGSFGGTWYDAEELRVTSYGDCWYRTQHLFL
jgi:hypothetical protein